jgi:hypothetical protein
VVFLAHLPEWYYGCNGGYNGGYNGG